MSVFTRRTILAATAGAVAMAMLPQTAAAQGETIRIIYPYAGGSTVNGIIRKIAEHMSGTLGQAVVVEDKPGGNGIVATQSVALGPKDGTMVLVGASGTLSLNSLLRPNLPYKIEDFEPVGMMLKGPLTVTINVDTPVTDMKGLVDWAKAENRPLRYGTLGPGSVTHLFGILLGKATGVETIPVAYRNNNAQILDLLAGQNELNFSTPASLIEHEKAGEVKMLAVTTEERMTNLPETPTVAEAGFAMLETSFWDSLMVPKGTPKEVITRLNEALNAATQSEEIKTLMAQNSLLSLSGPPEAVNEQIASDLDVWGEIVRSEGITLN
ncbi:Bug family tripartite tricarboxylate transporter substrate binding protein [Acuticoccus sediminis]|nr:tripartite tricarboxylate transporter substrate binding protein [Acuticoccus sediminis]